MEPEETARSLVTAQQPSIAATDTRASVEKMLEAASSMRSVNAPRAVRQ
jgi:hypothetical protein